MDEPALEIQQAELESHIGALSTNCYVVLSFGLEDEGDDDKVVPEAGEGQALHGELGLIHEQDGGVALNEWLVIGEGVGSGESKLVAGAAVVNSVEFVAFNLVGLGDELHEVDQLETLPYGELLVGE